MNRLILVGNGFDLAHKMKTKYSDFLLHYIRSCFVRARKDGECNNELVSVKQIHSNGRRMPEEYTDLKDFLFF